MSRYMKIRRRIAAVILSFGMVMSPMAGTVVSHAENAQEVKGEAIVCFRQEPSDAFKSDAALKDDQEKEIESESYVDESEALLVVDSPDEVLAAAADLDAATGMIDEEVADSVDTDDSDLPGVITLVQSDRLSTQELIAEHSCDIVIKDGNPPVYRCAGTSLKAIDSWEKSLDNTNEYGFSIVAAGIVNSGKFMNQGITGYLWASTTQYESESLATLVIFEYNEDYTRFVLTKPNSGLSVRCVKGAAE